MNPNKINITFLLSKNRVNQAGKCSIRCRITYQKKRYEFASGLFVNPTNWFSKQQIAKPSTEENTFINNELSLIKNKINQAFLLLQIQTSIFAVSDIYSQYRGKTIVQNKGIVEYFKEYLEKNKRLIGIEIKQATWNKFSYILSSLIDLIKLKFKQNEYLLKDLDYSFIIEFEYYLKTEKKQKQVTVNKSLQRFKKVVKTAVTGKLIDTNPFVEHKVKRVITNVIYLTTAELANLEKQNFSQNRLEQVKDLFVFCCYTGLAYNEMSKLESKHIVIGFDDNKWIQMIREKTNKLISVPLLQKPKAIIDKYETENCQYLLPRISNQKFNSYLKEIAEIIGLEKNLTHHIARKTFASTVLLYNDVPMEIVSELLGHSKMSITQEYYGKIVQKKVSEHIANLEKKLK